MTVRIRTLALTDKGLAAIGRSRSVEIPLLRLDGPRLAVSRWLWDGIVETHGTAVAATVAYPKDP